MATRVEVGSITPLTGVPGLGDIAKEEALTRTCFRPAGDAPGPPSASPLRSRARSFPFGPTLAPKPFFREKAPARPSPSSSSSSSSAAARAPGEKMPSLGGQEAGDEGPRRGSPLAPKAAFPRPSASASTLILFETTKAGPALGKGLGEGAAEAEAKAKAGESQDDPAGPRPEAAAKPALPARRPGGTLPRPAPLPQDSRLAAPREDAGPGGEDAGGPPSVEPRPHPKRRPASAVFPDSLQPQRLGPAAGRAPPAPPEKPWARRPRPVSMDLTAAAPCESKDALTGKAAGEAAAAGPPSQRRGPGMSPPGPPVDGESLVKAEAPRPDADSDFLEVAKKIRERREKRLSKQAEPSGGLRTARGSAGVPPADGRKPGGEKARLDAEPEKAPESPPPRPGTGPEAAEVKGRASDGEARPPGEWVSRGSVKKRLSLFGEENALAAAVAGPEPPPAPPEPEKAGLSVRDRIKGWTTTESSKAKAEVRRKAFRARPQSADMTKLFLSSASSSDVGYERCPEPSGELAKEPGEKQKEGPGLDGTPAAGSPWRPGPPREKARPAPREEDGAPEDEGSFQTVRATVFEHHVERHTVVAGQRGRCPSATPPGRGPGEDPPEKAILKRESPRWSHTPGPERAGRAPLSNGDPTQHRTPAPERPSPAGGTRGSRPFLQGSEHPPGPQRVEPKFDVVHTAGERAHSEAVPAAPEGTAVELRGGGGRARLPPADPERGGPRGRAGSVQRASLIWEARGTREASGPAPDPREPPRAGTAGSWHRATLVVSGDGGPETSQAQRQGPEGAGSKPGGRARGGDGAAPPRGCPPPGDDDDDDDAPSRATGEPSGLLRARPPAEGRLQRGAPAPDEPEVRMRRGSPGDQRFDKWRRRTLPHDVKFEEFSLLPAEGVQPRPEYPSPPAGAGRPQPSGRRAEARQQGDAALPAAAAAAWPGPSGEPRATFFAVTYQVPDAQKAKGVVKPGPGRLTDYSRKSAPPPSPHPSASTLVSPKPEEPPEAAGSRSRGAQGREREDASLANTPKPTDASSPAGDRVLDLSAERVFERIFDADAAVCVCRRPEGRRPAFQNDWREGGGAPQTIPAFPKAGDPPARRSSERVCATTSPDRATRGGYRSSVLDIDALMAEYKKPGAPARTEGPPAEPGRAQEQPGRRGGGGADRRRRSLQEAPEGEGPRRHAGFAETSHGSSPASGKQPAETPGAATSPRLGSPPWALPPGAPEKQPGAPAGPGGPGKRVSGTAEDEAKASARKHHGAKRREDPGDGAGVPPIPSPADRKKGTPRRPTGRGEEGRVAQWGDPPPYGRSPPDVRRASSEKGAPAKIREGLSVMQEARERRREQSKGRPSLAGESPEANTGPCPRDPGTGGSPKVTSRDPGREEALQDGDPPLQQASPVTLTPRRSHSFCKDKRNGAFVDQLKQCFSRRPPEAKDTDTLVPEADSQYGTWRDPHQSAESVAPESPSPDSSAASSAWKQPSSSRLSSLSSPTEAVSAGDQRRPSADCCSTDLESADGTEGPPPPGPCSASPVDDFSFIDQTSVLDSSALKTRVQLSKKSRRRAPISHSLRRSRVSESESRSPLEEEEEDTTWMFKDSTEEKPPPRREESDEEEKLSERSPGGHPQRMPVFPGIDPAALKAQLHKRPEADGPSETPGWAPQPRTPKSPFQLGSRVLPSSVEKDERVGETSPQWLKDLRSKKRQSLYENQA